MKNLDHILLENQDGFSSLTMSESDWVLWIEHQKQVWRLSKLFEGVKADPYWSRVGVFEAYH